MHSHIHSWKVLWLWDSGGSSSRENFWNEFLPGTRFLLALESHVTNGREKLSAGVPESLQACPNLTFREPIRGECREKFVSDIHPAAGRIDTAYFLYMWKIITSWFKHLNQARMKLEKEGTTYAACSSSYTRPCAWLIRRRQDGTVFSDWFHQDAASQILIMCKCSTLFFFAICILIQPASAYGRRSL